MAERKGEEFREDLRRPGARNAQARRLLGPEELLPLTRLSTIRSVLAIAQTAALIAAAVALAVLTWPSPWMLVSIVVLGTCQHALFILAHEAAHYRLFANRRANDLVGRAVGMAGGISMCTYRVTHRLHHNNLYTEEDPDTAIHGGYPRGRAYLWKKLARDIAGLNAWKTFAYFFGAPAVNRDTNRELRPLDDTSAELRTAARRDRLWVAAFHVAAPLLAFALGGWHGLLLYVVLWMLPLVTVLQPILPARRLRARRGRRPRLAPDRRSHQPHLGRPGRLARTLLPVPAPRELPPGAPPLSGRAPLPPAAVASPAAGQGRPRGGRGARHSRHVAPRVRAQEDPCLTSSRTRS